MLLNNRKLEWNIAENMCREHRIMVSWREDGYYFVPCDGYTPKEKAIAGPFDGVEEAMRSLLDVSNAIITNACKQTVRRLTVLLNRPDTGLREATRNPQTHLPNPK